MDAPKQIAPYILLSTKREPSAVNGGIILPKVSAVYPKSPISFWALVFIITTCG